MLNVPLNMIWRNLVSGVEFEMVETTRTLIPCRESGSPSSMVVFLIAAADFLAGAFLVVDLAVELTALAALAALLFC